MCNSFISGICRTTWLYSTSILAKHGFTEIMHVGNHQHTVGLEITQIVISDNIIIKTTTHQ